MCMFKLGRLRVGRGLPRARHFDHDGHHHGWVWVHAGLWRLGLGAFHLHAAGGRAWGESWKKSKILLQYYSCKSMNQKKYVLGKKCAHTIVNKDSDRNEPEMAQLNHKLHVFLALSWLPSNVICIPGVSFTAWCAHICSWSIRMSCPILVFHSTGPLFGDPRCRP